MKKEFLKLIFFLLLMFFNTKLILSQDTLLVYPSAKEIDVLVNTAVDIEENDYVYIYKIMSTELSEQNVYSFDVSIASEVSGINSPNMWRGSISNVRKRVVSWGSRDSLFDITPSQSLEGFNFISDAPPSIVYFFARGFAEIPNVPYGEAPPLAATEGSDIFENSVNGKTIGPQAPPDPFNHLDFLDSLRSYIPQAYDLGWEGDQAFTEELGDLLEDTRSHLITEDSTAAANTLQSFINLVEQTNNGSGPPGAELTSEGYALLFYNAMYLLERLPEPDPGSDITCECENQVTQTSGTITLSNGETACLAGDFSGSVFFESGGTLNVCSTATLQNIYGNQPGVVNISETGNVSVGNWNNNYSGDAINNWGTLDFSNWITVNNGSFTNHGTASISGGLNQNNGVIANLGEMSVSQSVTLNQPGNINDGVLDVNESLTLNSNADLVNTCRLEVGGQLMINGEYRNSAGSLSSVGGQVTINSGGLLGMEGENTMVSANRMILSGAINSTGGVNLVNILEQFNYNSGAVIATGDDPLYVCSPDNNALINNFDVADGCQVVIPVSECNPDGFNN